MAVAGIIAAAVGVMLLIVVGYVVVGATITTAETVTSAQKDVTLQNEIRLGTAFNITDPQKSISNITSIVSITANISNTGNEIISDFRHMDVIVYDSNSINYQICTYNTSGSLGDKQWTADFGTGYDLNTNKYWDSGETLKVTAKTVIPSTGNNVYFQFALPNGIWRSNEFRASE